MSAVVLVRGVHFVASKNRQIGRLRVNSYAPAGECARDVEVITAIRDCVLAFSNRVQVERQHGGTSLLPRASRSCSLKFVLKKGESEVEVNVLTKRMRGFSCQINICSTRMSGCCRYGSVGRRVVKGRLLRKRGG